MPVPKSQTSSTISRLESKYSEILGRVAANRQKKEIEDDRDKTLEPEKPAPPTRNPLMKSATSILHRDNSASLGLTSKERTPYRLSTRNRNKYLDGISSDGYKPRSELVQLHENNNTDYYAKIRADLEASRNYGRYDHYYTDLMTNKPKTSSSNSGYYEGRSGKENVYKSKYDPDSLYAEINNNNNDSEDSGGRSSRRPIKSYKSGDNSIERRYTTNYKLLPIDLTDNDNATSSSASVRKSVGYRRSQTQKFFDTENLNSVSSRNVPSTSRTMIDSSVSMDDDNPNRELTERETKRKEIQSLIMKYAQMDDPYSARTNDEPTTTTSVATGSELSKSTTVANITTTSSSQSNGTARDVFIPRELKNLYGRTSTNGNFNRLQSSASAVSIQHGHSHRSSRIPKPLSSFVRILLLFNSVANCFILIRMESQYSQLTHRLYLYLLFSAFIMVVDKLTIVRSLTRRKYNGQCYIVKV